MRFEVGTRVQLKGLPEAQAQHIGKCGRVVGYGGKRYKVKLLVGEEETTLKVKEANLEEAGADQASDDETTARHSENQKQLEDEDEVCPICLDPLVSEVRDFDHSKNMLLTCCGKRMCATCGTNSEEQLERCPLCRQPKSSGDEEDLERIRTHAARGQVWAYYHLGRRYETGDGVPRNYKLAYDWFRKAANKGHLPSFHRLGWLYEEGHGVKKSNRLARESYGTAAEAGYALSQLCYAMMYLRGTNGATKDVPKGLRLLRLAAEQGYHQAQASLGICYDKGIGVERSAKSAITWGLKAAKQNNPDAQHNVGALLTEFNNGLATPAAMYWARRAASQGQTDSMSFLTGIEKVIDSFCFNCCTKVPNPRRCSRCRSVSYCSQACQKEHWKKEHFAQCCDKNMDIKHFELKDFVSLVYLK